VAVISFLPTGFRPFSSFFASPSPSSLVFSPPHQTYGSIFRLQCCAETTYFHIHIEFTFRFKKADRLYPWGTKYFDLRFFPGHLSGDFSLYFFFFPSAPRMFFSVLLVLFFSPLFFSPPLSPCCKTFPPSSPHAFFYFPFFPPPSLLLFYFIYPDCNSPLVSCQLSPP